jgi:hypothetical protein
MTLLLEPNVLIFDDPDEMPSPASCRAPGFAFRLAPPFRSSRGYARQRPSYALPVPASLGSEVGSRAVLGMQISLWQSGFRRHAHRFCYSVRLSPQPLDACEPGEMRDDGRRCLGSGPQKTGAPVPGGGRMGARRQLDVLRQHSAAPLQNSGRLASKLFVALRGVVARRASVQFDVSRRFCHDETETGDAFADCAV